MKKSISLILAILLVFSAAGCSENSPASEASAAPKAEPSLAVTESSVSPDPVFTVTPTEVSRLKLVNYTDPEGRFTASIPEGWAVSTAVLPDMMFGINFYKPEEEDSPKYHAFVILKFQLMYSPEMKEFEVNNFGGFEIYDMLTEAVAIDSPTVSAMYEKFNEIMDYNAKYEAGYDSFFVPRLNNFTPIEEFPLSSAMASVALDDTIVRATYADVYDGSLQQGLFSGSLVTSAMGDGTYSAYNIMGICAPDAQFPEYESILNNVLSSVSFSDSFVSQIMSATQESYDTARQIGAELAAASQAYNDAWFQRQTSYDIISQKQSDATLGYERVYDPDTGYVYKADNGFADRYPDSGLLPVTDDMYTLPIEGYIE